MFVIVYIFVKKYIPVTLNSWFFNNNQQLYILLLKQLKKDFLTRQCYVTSIHTLLHPLTSYNNTLSYTLRNTPTDIPL